MAIIDCGNILSALEATAIRSVDRWSLVDFKLNFESQNAADVKEHTLRVSMAFHIRFALMRIVFEFKDNFKLTKSFLTFRAMYLNSKGDSRIARKQIDWLAGLPQFEGRNWWKRL